MKIISNVQHLAMVSGVGGKHRKIKLTDQQIAESLQQRHGNHFNCQCQRNMEAIDYGTHSAPVYGLSHGKPTIEFSKIFIIQAPNLDAAILNCERFCMANNAQLYKCNSADHY